MTGRIHRVLKIGNLAVSFGGLKAVDGVGFEVPDGTLVSLIGPNGAGKTTIFNILSGFLKPDSGQVLLGEEVLSGLKPHEIAKKGLVRTFQITNVFDGLSVEENVAFAHFHMCLDRPLGSIFDVRVRRTLRERQESKSRELLELVGLAKRAKVPASSLSYGELRLLEIAIALSAEPSHLLLDEPAAGLNNVESDKLRDLLRQLTKVEGLGILLVEHDMSVVMDISDNIVVVNFGRKLAEGQPSDIVKSHTVREAYLGDIDRLLGAEQRAELFSE